MPCKFELIFGTLGYHVVLFQSNGDALGNIQYACRGGYIKNECVLF